MTDRKLLNTFLQNVQNDARPIGPTILNLMLRLNYGTQKKQEAGRPPAKKIVIERAQTTGDFATHDCQRLLLQTGVVV